MIHLVRGELVRLRTLPTWRTVAVLSLLLAAVAVAWDCWQASIFMQPFDAYLSQSILRPRADISAEQLAIMRQLYYRNSDPARIAAHLLTSGQFFGLLLSALAAGLLVTGEYHHRLATASFLITPVRRRVVTAKLITAVLVAAALWSLFTAVDAMVSGGFLKSRGVGERLVAAGSLAAAGLNLGAYLAWAVFGFGLAALIRSQTVATAVITGLYLLSSAAALIFQGIHEFLIAADWVLTAQVALPAIASQIMTEPPPLFAHAPPPWVGAAVLLSYGAMAGAIGATRMRRRDLP